MFASNIPFKLFQYKKENKISTWGEFLPLYQVVGRGEKGLLFDPEYELLLRSRQEKIQSLFDPEYELRLRSRQEKIQ